MSRENVTKVRRAYEESGPGLEPPRELFAPDFELDVRELSPDFGVARGVEASLEVFRSYWETFDDFHRELEEVIHADEEQVVTRYRDDGRMKGSDSEMSSRRFHVWTFGGGKIVRLSVHTDRNRALEAAGVQE